MPGPFSLGALSAEDHDGGLTGDLPTPYAPLEYAAARDQTDRMSTLTGHDVEAADLPDWRIMMHALQTRYRTGDFATGLRLVNRIGAAAEAMNHHPDLDLRYTHLNIRLYSHDVFGVTDRDLRLARTISELAAEEGVAADPGVVSLVELGLDTPDHTAIKPFWRAVLGLRDHPEYDQEVRDDNGDLPTIWFQKTEPHEEPRQRFHLDIRVPPEVADERIAAALAAGGVLVSDERAPAYTILADADGNKVCVCTWKGRD
jgi:4a-hydroxytetrahydrobiopterin dehydratase